MVKLSKTKAGIIVGIGIIVIALVFFIIFGIKLNPDNEKDDTKQNEVQTEQVQTTQAQEQQPVQTNVQTTQNTQIIEVSDESFSSLTKQEVQEIAVVSRKYIQCDSKMQLFYTVDVILSNNQNVSYYVSEPGYAYLNVGDKVNVSYVVCTNANGAKFVLVNAVTTVE